MLQRKLKVWDKSVVGSLLKRPADTDPAAGIDAEREEEEDEDESDDDEDDDSGSDDCDASDFFCFFIGRQGGGRSVLCCQALLHVELDRSHT